MNKRGFWFVTVTVWLLGAVALSWSLPVGRAVADNLRFDEQELTVRAINRVNPAVVSISVFENLQTSLETADGRKLAASGKSFKGAGSGFLISDNGYILTNKHVVDMGGKKAEYKVALANGKQQYAQLVGRDPINDLAVLRIYGEKLPKVEIGSSGQLPVGATVLAIGNALGKYSNSATKGIVSGKGRTLIAADEQGSLSSLDNIIQTDAGINEGNSGGPLIDLNGRVVGINVAIDRGGESIGFAIPIDDARPVIDSVLSRGRIVRSRLGVRYVLITPELAEEQKLSRDSGALISKSDDGDYAVALNSPAMKAGLQEGDIITEADGLAIDRSRPLSAVVQRKKPGDKVKLKVIRDKVSFTIEIVLDEFIDR